MSRITGCRETLFNFAKTRSVSAAKFLGLFANIATDAVWTYMKYRKEHYCKSPAEAHCGDTLKLIDRSLIAAPLGTFGLTVLGGLLLTKKAFCRPDTRKIAKAELTTLTGCFFYLSARCAYDIYWSEHSNYDELPDMDAEQLGRDLALMAIEIVYMFSEPLSVLGERLWSNCLPEEKETEGRESLLRSPTEDISGMGGTGAFEADAGTNITNDSASSAAP
jgi:hypothetical protein